MDYETLIPKEKINFRIENESKFFIQKILNDKNNMLRYISPDKRNRIHGDKLFPINILINKGVEDIKIVKSYLSKDDLDKVEFLSFCCELENTVVLNLWLDDSDNTISDNKINLFKEIKNNKNNNKYTSLNLDGNYLIGNNNQNYSTILMFKSNSKIITQNNIFFDWKYMPFIKKSSETIKTYMSPSFSPVMFDSKLNKDAFQTYFSSIFKVKSISNNVVKIEVLNHFMSYKSNSEFFDVGLDDLNLLNELSKIHNEDRFVLGLFIDKLYKYDSKYYSREIFLVDLFSDTTPEEILYHKIIQRIYYHYLITFDFRICLLSELKKIYIKECELLSYIGIKIKISFDNFISSFLNNYVVVINDFVYYKPYLLFDLDQNTLGKIYSAYKEECDNCYFGNYSKEIYNLFFLNIYNSLSKKTLIDRIKKWDNKWKIKTI
jgi:hypothetical protein